jgi:hypothetical protein
MRMRILAGAVAAAAALLCGPAEARAGYLPYAATGVENPITYTFTATATGDVIAYFAGSTAAFVNEIGLSVNGGPVAAFGLNNHTTPYGTSFHMGSVTAGDTLVFVMRNISHGLGDLYSDPSLNGPYDGVPGHNHVYSTAFTTDGIIPDGTFVAFEDLPLYAPPNWNYDDENFVFTNVSATATPEPGTLALLGTGLAGLCCARRRKPKAE